MARLEFQIAASLILKSLQQVLQQRLYARCFVSPITGLIINNVELAVPGPIKPAQGKLDVDFQVTIFVVTPNDVQAAGGGLAKSELDPDGVSVTARVVVSIKGTVLTAKYDKVIHDTAYQKLESLVAALVGSQQAQTLFSEWEQEAKQVLGASPLITFDCEKMMPPSLRNLVNSRSMLCASSEAVAARFEVGNLNSDGNWNDFFSGKLSNMLSKNDWILFVSGDVLVEIVNGMFAKVVSSIPCSVSSGFYLLATSQGYLTTFLPTKPIAAETACVYTAITIDYTVTFSFLGATVETDHDSVVVGTDALFTVSRHADGKRTLDADLSYDVQNNLDDGFILGLVSDFIDPNLTLPSGFAPPGFTPTGPQSYHSSTLLPDVSLDDILTLTVKGGGGTVRPPISAAVENEIKGLSDPPPITEGIFSMQASGAGLLIFGDAKLASGKTPPKFSLSAKPFALTFTPAAIGAGNQVWGVPTPAYVPAVATLHVHNSGAHPSDQFPLIVGALLPVDDPALQWLQSPPVLPATPAKAGTFVISVPESDFRPGYMSNPYPLSLIVCTSGGARFVSLGAIPKPIVDPATGFVTNAYIPQLQPPSTQGQPPSGPHGTIISNKAPSMP